MIKEINDFLAGLPMTVVSGIFLLFAFLLPRMGVSLPFSPAWFSVVISGIPLLYLALWRVVHNTGIRRISSALLIVIAMLAAVGIGDLFAAGEVAFIMALGAVLEDMTTNRAKKGLKKLIDLAPSQGRRILDGREELIFADQIRTGDRIRILPGEAIPVDGVILQGETSVDQSVMTGESLPVDKAPGDEVCCGTINRFGSIDVRASRVGEDSSLKKLVRLVEEAERKQAPMQRIADRWAAWLVPIALLIALISGFVTHSLLRAVTVLVVFCPCALVLATPTAIVAAIGQAAKHGVIIKSGDALEKMGKIKTIAFDKTGTLTYGQLEVSDAVPLDPSLTSRKLLALAASAEAKSEHPLGRAIVGHALAQGLSPAAPQDFRMDAGKGVYAKVNGYELYCGNENYLREHEVYLSEEAEAALEKLRKEGKASVLVGGASSPKADASEARGFRKCLGVLALSDTLRPEARDVIAGLSAMGTQTLLLTGDNPRTAACFARQAGITQIRAGLLPQEKTACIEALQQEGRGVCMVGDGVNDAPALKAAWVGAAMGSMGSDIAIDAADVALMSDDLTKLPYLKRLSDATVKTIKGSIALSMAINFAAVACSVLGLLTPTTGALVHNAGSCLVILIAALLYDRKFAP